MKHDNVIIVSKEAYPRGRYRKPLKWFIGKVVKIRFLNVADRAELMWVKVTGEGIGILDNDPLHSHYLRYGDLVNFRPSDVLDIRTDTQPPKA